MATPMSELPPLGFDRRDAARWRFSNIALTRLHEHGFNEADVYAAILNPQRRDIGEGGAQIRTRGNVSAVVDPVEFKVITVMDAYGRRPQRRQVALAPAVKAPQPAPVKPEAVPILAATTAEEVADELAEYGAAEPGEVTNMAARVRMLSLLHADEVPPLPKRWLQWVCLPRLREYPGRWGRMLSAPYPSIAAAMAEQIQTFAPDLEIAVRGPHIYGRST